MSSMSRRPTLLYFQVTSSGTKNPTLIYFHIPSSMFKKPVLVPFLFELLHKETNPRVTAGYEVLGAPPPSSGGATVIQILKTLSAFDMPLAALGALGTHRIAEAFKHAFAMRMSLGDPDVSKPLSRLFPCCYYIL